MLPGPGVWFTVMGRMKSITRGSRHRVIVVVIIIHDFAGNRIDVAFGLSIRIRIDFSPTG